MVRSIYRQLGDAASRLKRWLTDAIRDTVDPDDNGGRRRYLCWLFAWGALGIFLRALFDIRPYESAKAVAEFVLTIGGLEAWLENSVSGKQLKNWIAAPVVTIFIGACSYRVFAERWKRAKGGRPDFAIKDPYSAISEMHHIPGYVPGKFIGRRAQLLELKPFLRAAQNPFAWKMITGRTGIGKTRLCIELVVELRQAARSRDLWTQVTRWSARFLRIQATHKQAWDAGFVDPHRCEELMSWYPRRPTLLIFDEASLFFADSLNRLLTDLSAKGTPRRPIRVLVIDHIQYDSFQRLLGAMSSARGRGETLALGPMPDTDLAQLAQSLPGQAQSGWSSLTAAGGNPRSALHLLMAAKGESYRSAIRTWSNNLIPGLAPPDDRIEPTLSIDGGIAETLIATALIGPLTVSASAGRGTDDLASKLRRFYPHIDRKTLSETLPPLEPRELAYDIAFRLYDLLSQTRRDTIMSLLLTQPVRLRNSLHEFWFELNSDFVSKKDERLVASALEIQRSLDTAQPEVVKIIHDDLMRHLEELNAAHDVETVNRHLVIARLYLKYRPFDRFIAETALKSDVNASRIFGRRGINSRIDFRHILNLRAMQWMNDVEIKELYFKILTNYAISSGSGLNYDHLIELKRIAEEALDSYRGGPNNTADLAMGIANNLLSSLIRISPPVDAKELYFTMRHVVGRVGGSASRDFLLNFAGGLLNILNVAKSLATVEFADSAWDDLYALGTQKRFADDAAMQSRLVGGAINVAHVLSNGGTEPERRKIVTRLERIIAPHMATTDADLRILVCSALTEVIHRHAVRGRFDQAAEAFGRLDRLALDATGQIRSDCQGSVMRASACLLTHYSEFDETELSTRQMAAIFESIGGEPYLTAETADISVLGELIDLNNFIDGWRQFNHRLALNGRDAEFIASFKLWNRFFLHFMEVTGSTATRAKTLHQISKLVDCAQSHVAAMGDRGASLSHTIRNQRFRLYARSPSDRKLMEAARSVEALHAP